MNDKQDGTEHKGARETTLELFNTQTMHDDKDTFADALLSLADEFAEFNSMNAFLSSAFAAVLSSKEVAREEVIQGARQCAMQLQARSQALKESLDQVRALYRPGQAVPESHE